jgi:hypothetical protein
MSGTVDGIWPPYEAFYIEAMLSNTRSTVASLERLNDIIEAIETNTSGDVLDHIDRGGMLDEFQNIVLQAAALSRYFWPPRSGHENRAAHLRTALGVADDNPLRNRDLRNEIEHFDEKLDTYLAAGISGYILPEYVGPLPESDGVPTHMFKAYYLDAGIFEMLGNRYQIQPLADEILRLHEVLMSCRQGGRLIRPEDRRKNRP